MIRCFASALNPAPMTSSSPTLFSAIPAGILKAFDRVGSEGAEMAARHARPRRVAIRPSRAAIVVASVALCGVAGAGSASAATMPAAEPQTDVLGLGQLLGGLTDGLTDTLGLGATAPVGADAGDESPSLAKIISGLPLLGPTLGGVVDSLPLLGSGAPAAGPTGSGSPPAKPGPATSSGHHSSTSTVTRNGSTWTAPKPPGLMDTSSSGGSSHHGMDGAAATVRNVASLLPQTTAGKAGLGAAALALIVLGGVAVTGAAGAAGAAGRREFIGGAW
jgi:hypothetical protein